MADQHRGDEPADQAEAQPLAQPQVRSRTPEKNEMRQESNPHTDDKGTKVANLERNIKMGEVCLIIINGLLLVTSIVIACIYYGQLQQMTKATEATEKAAKAAEDSASLTRQQVVAQNAVTLRIDFSVLYRYLPGEASGLRSVLYYQSGGVMSTDIHQTIEVAWKDPKTLRDVGTPQHFEFHDPFLRSGNNISHTIPLEGLNGETWEAIRVNSLRRTIGVKGTLRYKNGFDVTSQDFCYIWYAHPEVTGSIGTSAQNFVECERYKNVFDMFAAWDKAAETNK